uniref:Uncharacterized protein n=1 Tax=Nonomuraea gerenzanensis TaxID=93944 RepID=A0A1M4ELA3_9ACTN|nr:hypothetical protein BN4615_P8849 [Nonomuraea gerenzanensis]
MTDELRPAPPYGARQPCQGHGCGGTLPAVEASWAAGRQAGGGRPGRIRTCVTRS